MELTGWRVTSQRPEETFDGNVWVRGHVVTVETDAGVAGSAHFPDAKYTVDNVVAYFNEWAARADAINALGNG